MMTIIIIPTSITTRIVLQVMNSGVLRIPERQKKPHCDAG